MAYSEQAIRRTTGGETEPNREDFQGALPDAAMGGAELMLDGSSIEAAVITGISNKVSRTNSFYLTITNIPGGGDATAVLVPTDVFAVCRRPPLSGGLAIRHQERSTFEHNKIPLFPRALRRRTIVN